ncbi:MAG: hypothetical protein SFW62_05295 [Alphaproteobacteria bacterium]|nr:hypothetical protein [Alphaproteobacteria bacterium]
MRFGDYEFEKGVEFSGGSLKGIGVNPIDDFDKASGAIVLFARRGENWRLDGSEGRENSYGINVVQISDDDEWNAHFIPVGTADLETALISVLTRLTRDGVITKQQRAQTYEAFGVEGTTVAVDTHVLTRPQAWARSIARKLGL